LPATIALVLVAAAGFRHEQQVYTHRPYDAGAFNDPVAPIAHRLQDVHDARIAVVGLGGGRSHAQNFIFVFGQNIGGMASFWRFIRYIVVN
jgi:hypothetical protein